MNELDCPACAGPDNAGCDTCHGTSQVTKEVYDAFIAQRDIEEASRQLQQALSQLPVQVIPGVEQVAIVISTEDNTISAEVDSVPLTWDPNTGTWV